MSGRGQWARPEEGRRYDGHGLTHVHRDTLARLATGASYRDMAATLGITRDAAKNRALMLYRALGVTAKADALAVARERGLIDTSQDGQP